MGGVRNMKSLRKQIEDLDYYITGEIDHGECFYEQDDFYEFIGKLEQLKHLAFKYYEENKKEMRDEN
jgi:hypothetical protein